MRWFVPLLLASVAGYAQEPVEALLAPFFEQRDPRLRNVLVIERAAVGGERELILAGATSVPGRGPFFWEPQNSLGLFLRNDSGGTIHEICLLPGEGGGGEIEVLAVDSQRTILRTWPEKGGVGPRLTLTYDLEARCLRETHESEPVRLDWVVEIDGIPHFVLEGAERFALIRPGRDGLEVVSGDSARRMTTSWTESEPDGAFAVVEGKIVDRSGEGGSSYRLPQSTYAQFAKARPRRVRNGYREEHTTIEERIGPHHAVGDRLWFGKTFYDGEGFTGVGGLGNFDMRERKFTLFTAPELADFSASTILVESEAIWLGLVLAGEYGDTSGGLLRWDRASQRATRYELKLVIHTITRHGARIYVGTEDGLAVFDGSGFSFYLVDETAAGDYQLVRLSRSG